MLLFFGQIRTYKVIQGLQFWCIYQYRSSVVNKLYLFLLSICVLQAGVKNGMFMGPAKKLCPALVTIPYDFEGYQEVSKCLYDTVARYS